MAEPEPKDAGAEAGPMPPQTPPPDSKPRKKLVIFADGTGNAFSTQESNIWRLYEALDRSSPEQVARYIQGVGTSGQKIIAALDGATGFGVPSNVRELYRFICWNWDEETDLYLFGFSRGAFTIRTLVGLIASQGLMPVEIGGERVSSAEMDANAMGAWRAYRAGMAPGRNFRRVSPTIPIARFVRDLFVRGWRAVTGQKQHADVLAEIRNNQPQRKAGAVKVAFLGLFDTVEAYGVPIEELRRVIDWLIWPISFRNRECSPIVGTVYHALALDDERLTFHPLRFDQSPRQGADGEPLEQPKITESWFAGMHSDVGGGYPDDSLALIPLGWMARAAERAGLAFRPNVIDDFERRASVQSRIHDSRAGAAIFYRYAPRMVQGGKANGGDPVLHHSVVRKIVDQKDGYAPISLPKTVQVEMADGRLEPIKAFSTQERVLRLERIARTGPDELALNRLRQNPPSDEQISDVRAFISWRKFAYFALMATTFMIVLMPWIGGMLPSASAENGSATAQWDGAVDSLLELVMRAVSGLLPDFITPWVAALRDDTMVMLGLIGLWFGLFAFNERLKFWLRDSAVKAWAGRRRHPDSPQPAKPLLARLTLPDMVMQVYRPVAALVTKIIFPALVLALLFLALAVLASRLTEQTLTRAGWICAAENGPEQLRPEASKPLAPGEIVRMDGFSPDRLCWLSGVALRKGEIYTLWIAHRDPFADQTILAGAGGFQSDAFAHWLTAKTLRRETGAEWFQPLAQIGIRAEAFFPLQPIDGRRPGKAEGFGQPDGFWGFSQPWTALPEARRDAFRQRIDQRRGESGANSPNLFVARFTAPADGALALSVNDAVIGVPGYGILRWFYQNNWGRAQVIIRRESPETLAAPPPALP